MFLVDLTNTTDNFYTRTWRTVDDRFFFNKSLVQELIDLNDTRADAWIVPFIQGYVEIQECPLGNNIFHWPITALKTDVERKKKRKKERKNEQNVFCYVKYQLWRTIKFCTEKGSSYKQFCKTYYS